MDAMQRFDNYIIIYLLLIKYYIFHCDIWFFDLDREVSNGI